MVAEGDGATPPGIGLALLAASNLPLVRGAVPALVGRVGWPRRSTAGRRGPTRRCSSAGWWPCTRWSPTPAAGSVRSCRVDRRRVGLSWLTDPCNTTSTTCSRPCSATRAPGSSARWWPGSGGATGCSASGPSGSSATGSRDAERVVIAERLRIARELHDIAAHQVSVIAIQAEAGQALLPDQPEQAATVLATIGDAAARHARPTSGACSACCATSTDASGATATTAAATTPATPEPRPARRTARGPRRRCARRRRRRRPRVEGDRTRRCPTASTWPRTASCRRRSPTCSSTRAPAPRRGRRALPAAPARARDRATTGAAVGAARTAATGSSACASGSTSSAASSTPGRRRGGAGLRGAARPALPAGEHPGAGRRRPGPGPRRLPDDPRRRATTSRWSARPRTARRRSRWLAA